MASRYRDVEARLETIAAGVRADEYADAAAAMAALAQATSLVNRAISNAEEHEALAQRFSGDFGERLARWIEKLADIAAVIAEKFHAASYTISVGLPIGVSAGITWSS